MRTRRRIFVNREAASRMYNSFLTSVGFADCIPQSIYTFNGHASWDFPEYYGGAYINTDGDLVVIVSLEIQGNDYVSEEWYLDLLGRIGETGFIVRSATYSFGDLLDTATAIVFGDLNDVIVNYSYAGIAIDEYNNCVDVYLTNQEYVSEVEQLLLEMPCRVVVVDGVDCPTIGLYCGEGVVNSNGSFSVAFRARKTVGGSTYHGYLTCGHAFSGYSNVYVDPSQSGLSSNVLVGSVLATEQQYSGSTDAAFIRTNNNTTLYNTVFLATTTITTPVTALAQGDAVYMRGRTSGVSYGVVSNTSGTANYPGVTLTDVVIASYQCANGDSGGAVYTEPNAGYAHPVGIQSGVKPNGNSIYVKLSHVISALGVTLY